MGLDGESVVLSSRQNMHCEDVYDWFDLQCTLNFRGHFVSICPFL